MSKTKSGKGFHVNEVARKMINTLTPDICSKTHLAFLYVLIHDSKLSNSLNNWSKSNKNKEKLCAIS